MSRRNVLIWILGLAGPTAGANPPDDADESVYELGDGITPPRATRMKKPTYTDRARRDAIQGTVALRFVVTSKGLPVQILVTQSLDAELDHLAIEALGEWRFSPATKNGKPVAVHLKIEFEFGFV